MSDAGIIGINNRLPWKLPADMAWFRKNTLGKPIIMGRRTFESFGAKSLPERQNIVVTRDTNFQAQEIETATSIDQAIDLAGDAKEIMIIGGASIYKQTLPLATRLYMTVVHGDIEGDAWFPDYEREDWKEIERSNYLADEKNSFDYSFIILDKNK